MLRYHYFDSLTEAKAFLKGHRSAGGTGYYVGGNGDEFEVRTIHDVFSGDELEEQDDTPSLPHCDDWGTGEGRWHGRI